MRLVALLVFLLVSSSAASAQQRFVEACIAASQVDAVPEDARKICSCSAERSMQSGISASSLDGLMQYLDADGDLDVTGAPAPIQALSEVVGQTLFTCVFDAFDEAMVASGATRVDPPVSGTSSTGASAEAAVGEGMVSGATSRTARPRPGSGKRVVQAGKGAVYRILG